MQAFFGGRSRDEGDDALVRERVTHPFHISVIRRMADEAGRDFDTMTMGELRELFDAKDREARREMPWAARLSLPRSVDEASRQLDRVL